MKKFLIGLVLGIALSVTSVAVAAGYWSQGGSGYTCQGVSSGAICKSGGYSVGITRSFVYIQKGSGESAPTYACYKWRSWSSCIEG